MKHLPTLPQALTFGLISLCLSAPLGAMAKTKAPPSPLQCEKDGRMQPCEDSQSDKLTTKKGLAFKAQAADGADAASKSHKKSTKKGKKAAKKKSKRASVAE